MHSQGYVVNTESPPRGLNCSMTDFPQAIGGGLTVSASLSGYLSRYAEHHVLVSQQGKHKHTSLFWLSLSKQHGD